MSDKVPIENFTAKLGNVHTPSKNIVNMKTVT